MLVLFFFDYYDGGMNWRRIWQWLRLLFLAGLFLLLLGPQWPAFGDQRYRLRTIVGAQGFDYLTWEAKAVFAKATAVLSGGHSYLSPQAQQQVVLDYLALLRDVQQLTRSIDQIYAHAATGDPAAESLPLQRELAGKRAELAQMQPLAEAIIQDQVGAVLVDEGFGVGGFPWPPVMMHMSPLPSLMVVSPRERIEQIHSFSIQTGVTTPQREEMETAVYRDLDLSALIVPIGGVGIYPAMIAETSNINWLVEVVAHEWAHHWMAFFPIGWYYAVDPQVRIINETVASTIDREIGEQVIARFYPEFVPVPPPPTPVQPEPEPDPDALPPFDFRREMAETRIRTEELLAAGEVTAAEAYMEERRQYFVASGYQIRKLNQAYFAFYGAYAAEPGAAGADPIGPAIREIRALSPDLRSFMENMSQVSSFADLERVLAQLKDR